MGLGESRKPMEGPGVGVMRGLTELSRFFDLTDNSSLAALKASLRFLAEERTVDFSLCAA